MNFHWRQQLRGRGRPPAHLAHHERNLREGFGVSDARAHTAVSSAEIRVVGTCCCSKSACSASTVCGWIRTTDRRLRSLVHSIFEYGETLEMRANSPTTSNIWLHFESNGDVFQARLERLFSRGQVFIINQIVSACTGVYYIPPSRFAVRNLNL